LAHFSTKLKKVVEGIGVRYEDHDHNLGLDFIISVNILSEMLVHHRTGYFAEHSFVEEIVETEPTLLVNDQDINELRSKWELFVKGK
jgi:hypothetical protein